MRKSDENEKTNINIYMKDPGADCFAAETPAFLR